MSRFSRAATLGMAFLLILALASTATARGRRKTSTAGIPWHTNYSQAMAAAKQSRKMLFIYFHGSRRSGVSQFESRSMTPKVVNPRLNRYIWLKLPVNAGIRINGRTTRLLSHAAFREMHGRQGIAIVDLKNKGSNYGRTVSMFPFTRGKYYTASSLKVILDLPQGSLTQRTMIYAVRIHPEAPASTHGTFNTVLASEAESHSRHQAQIRLQGHHSWDTRFHRINNRLSSGVLAQEVVAESWPNEELVEAAVECVDCWRQSPGHWSAVRQAHPVFGYDMKRGRNGIWYATGIFGNRLFGR